MLTPEFRDQFLAESQDGRLVLTIYQGQIIGITPAQWDAFEAELDKPATPSPTLQNNRRVPFAGYVEVVLDTQGRIQLPTHLRKSGRLTATWCGWRRQVHGDLGQGPLRGPS
jgi:MraZ protein